MKITCTSCKQAKNHHAKGLCHNCYHKTDKYKAYQKVWQKAHYHKLHPTARYVVTAEQMKKLEAMK